jgi:hypothetical protein
VIPYETFRSSEVHQKVRYISYKTFGTFVLNLCADYSFTDLFCWHLYIYTPLNYLENYRYSNGFLSKCLWRRIVIFWTLTFAS